MLDPQLIADEAVRRFASSREQAEALMRNPIYKNVSRMIAGISASR